MFWPINCTLLLIFCFLVLFLLWLFLWHAAYRRLPPHNPLFYGTTTLFVLFCGIKYSLWCYMKHTLFDRHPPSMWSHLQDIFCTYQAIHNGKIGGWHIVVGVIWTKHRWRLKHCKYYIYFQGTIGLSGDSDINVGGKEEGGDVLIWLET